MMFLSLGIGVVLAVVLITVVSLLTGGKVTNASSSNALDGQTVAVFHATGLDGGTVTAPWASGHPTVLLFFASWCAPCHREVPRVAAYLRAHRNLGDVRVLAVDVADEASSAKAFVRAAGLDVTVVTDPNRSLAQGTFSLVGLPDTVFVTNHGVVENVHQAGITNAALAAGIAALRS
jgi:thiol-disulfide isomerase/thioredoxin